MDTNLFLACRTARSTSALLLITASLFVGACSCDSSRATLGDAAMDSGSSDAATTDGASGDSGTDAGNPCSGLADGAACALGGGGSGLCAAMVCAPCVDPTDDGACVTAYGAGNRCVSGRCFAAECRTDANCAGAGKAGQICGLTAANQCSPCTGDSQCQAAPGYGAGTICSIASGTCISAACGTAGTTATTTSVSTACTNANPADFCCSAGIATTCVPGNCCSMADCSGGANCIAHTCTTCTAVANNTYYVDPVNGVDTGSTGSTTCPFRSLTRAMQFLGSTGSAIPAGTFVLLRNDSLRSNATRGETFPISVPPNVTVRSELPASRRTIEIGVGSTGFNLTAANSSIQSLTIDGVADGRNGIAVSGSASNTTTTLSDLSVKNMANDGIVVSAGGVAIGAGVLVTANGQNPGVVGTGDGLHVTGGNANVTVQVGGARTGFDQNAGSGIHVTGGGSVTLRGFPDVTGYPGTTQNPPSVASGTGTVTANQNQGPNLVVSQSGNAKPLNSVRGLVAWGSSADGMQLSSGSNVGIRDCVVVNNARSGIRVVASPAGFITAAGATINLGPDNLGHNILQTPTNGNQDAGICVDGLFFNTMQSLSAKANYFNGHDCAAAASGVVVTSSLDGCSNGIDVGIERTPGNMQQTNIRVLLDFCASL